MALLHCAIFPATCNTFGRGKLGARFKMAKWEIAHALVESVPQKLRGKLLEGWYTVQWHCKLLQCVAKSRPELYFMQRCAQQKTLRDNPCYTVQSSSNLFRNGVARQVAEKIAQCNSTLKNKCQRPRFFYRSDVFLIFCSQFSRETFRLSKSCREQISENFCRAARVVIIFHMIELQSNHFFH